MGIIYLSVHHYNTYTLIPVASPPPDVKIIKEDVQQNVVQQNVMHLHIMNDCTYTFRYYKIMNISKASNN